MRGEGWVVRHGALARRLAGGVATAAITAGAAAAEAAPPTTAPEVVRAVVAARPSRLSDLEAIIGSLGRDPGVWEQAVGPLVRRRPSRAVLEARVGLAIDVLHADPREEADPALAAYALRFAGSADATRQVLVRAFGPASPGLAAGEQGPWGQVGTVERFAAGGRRRPGSPVAGAGDFFLTPDAAGLWHELSWHAAEPDWAIPARGAAEGSRLVEAIARASRDGFRRDAFESALGAFERDTGTARTWVLHGETWRLEFTDRVTAAGAPAGDGGTGGDSQPESLVLLLRRPLGAAESRDLLAGLGIAAPRVTAPDVHQASRRIVDAANPRSEETGYALPARAGYVLAISVLAEGLEPLPQAAEARGGPWWSAEGARVSGLRAFLPVR